MYKKRLPVNQIHKVARYWGPIWAFPFFTLACVIFYNAPHEPFYVWVSGIVALAISGFFFFGSLILTRKYLRFKKNVWKESTVRQVMEQDRCVLKKSETMCSLLPPTDVPRSVSLGLRLALLLALIPYQRFWANFKIGNNGILFGFLIYIFYLTFRYFGVGMCESAIHYDRDGMVLCFVFLLVLFFIWGKSFFLGWRTIHLLRRGKVTNGIIRNHKMTGCFFQFFDENGNAYWNNCSHFISTKQSKVTVLYDPRNPSKSLILEELTQLQQIQITKNSGFRLAPKQILSILLAVAMAVCVSYCFRSPSLEELSPYVGKTETELCSQFGEPDGIAIILIASPDNLSDEEYQKWRATASSRTLWYGKIRVKVNLDGKIIQVYKE
ncbi:MAG: hypothetical protein Q4C70_08750 [Planctomycetia bacterium]|nr:hypothetical protein [Planctomycetia bacterium]